MSHRWFVLLMAVILMAPAARACEFCTMENPEGDGFMWDDPVELTYTCFSNPPTVTACTAYASRNQACRECAPKFWDDGDYADYFVCAYVTRSSACECVNALTDKCAGRGSCTYR